jgi:hypothetical protein
MAISSKIARGTAAKITARKEAAATASTIKTNRQAALNNAANKTPIQMASKSTGKSVLERTKAVGKLKENIAAKKAGTAPASVKPATIKEKFAAKKSTPAPATATPLMQKKKMVSKKTAYDIKEASNPKLKASARKNYAMNAEASMKNKKKK